MQSKNIGDQLRDARLKMGVEWSTIERATKINRGFLEALEKEKWSAYTSKTYIFGHLRKYCDFLGLDNEKIVALFRRDYIAEENPKFRKRVSSHYFTPHKVKVMRYLVALAILLVGSYFSFQIYIFTKNPKIEIIEPKEFTFTRESQMRIVGKTEKEVIVKINGDQVYPDKEGKFSFDLPLPNDSNSLQIEVEGANGKKTILNKSIHRKIL